MTRSDRPVVGRVDPADEDAVRRWHTAFEAGATAGRVHPLVRTADAMLARLRDPEPRYDLELWVAECGGEAAGTLLVETSRHDNPHLGEIELDVVPERRRRGVGAALWEVAERRCAELGRTTILTELNVPVGTPLTQSPGHRFGVARGFAVVHTEDRLLLELPVDVVAPPIDGYDVLTWPRCPDELVEEYAALHTMMHRDMPLGEVDWEPTEVTVADVRRNEARRGILGWSSIVAAARETATGRLVGYSELLVSHEQPTDAQQEDTLVHRAHRGHGLGLAMKAANLAVLRRDFPDAARVQTWTALDNAPMQAVNAACGFRPVERLHELQRRT